MKTDKIKIKRLLKNISNDNIKKLNGLILEKYYGDSKIDFIETFLMNNMDSIFNIAINSVTDYDDGEVYLNNVSSSNLHLSSKPNDDSVLIYKIDNNWENYINEKDCGLKFYKVGDELPNLEYVDNESKSGYYPNENSIYWEEYGYDSFRDTPLTNEEITEIKRNELEADYEEDFPNILKRVLKKIEIYLNKKSK